jgi:predicted transcriptional regulator
MPAVTKVRDVMTTPVVTLRSDERVEHAADVVGIVARADVVRFIARTT